MGAATPVQLQPGGGASEVGEKMVSYFRTEMAATARARGRRGDIAEAMVDPDVQIEGITPSGKLLTLDTDNALALGVADVLAGSLDELLSALYMDGARIVRPTPSWAHRLARLFTHPAVSGLLMTLGLLGILIELRAPGFGAPGIVGIAALVLFFFGHHVVHLAGWEELLLFGLGVVLLLVEGFVIPGFGFVGVLGAAAVVASLVLALSGLPLGVSFSSGEITTSLLRVLASVALSIGGFALAALVLPRTRAGRPLVLRMKLPAGSSHDGRPAGASSTAAPTFERGDRGRSLTILRPAGKVRVRGRVTVAESEGPFIDRDREVVVVRVHGDRVLVREIPDDGVG
jgi:membrane-bound serine protease (ClpP class)